MTSHEARAIPSVSRSVLVTSLGWLTIVVGALGTPISALALLMILAGGPGSSISDPLGFLIVVVGPPAAIVAGIGLLRRKRWARYFLIALLLWALAHDVYLLARGPIPQSTYVSPAGVPTTVLATPVSPYTVPTILACACLLVALLLPKVRMECSVS
jgi:hypothetical protein